MLVPVLAPILALGACGSVLVRNPVPAASVETVAPLGVAGLRTWGDTVSLAELEALVAERTPVMRATFGPEIAAGRIPEVDYLALSGGGQWGAFGAGILGAWSDRGDRPEFFGVSGVSTGAIIAPFAFLGPKYDATLREIYSSYSTDDLVTPTIFSGLVSGTALADTSPLAGVIAKYITPELVAEIAAEHARGRILMVGTTNLDAGRPVIWNLGAIAATGRPEAVDLVRQLILASASIPVAFPPQIIAVQTPDGQSFDEMHVDGGASSQVTFISPDVPLSALTRLALGTDIARRLWVIVNNDLSPPYAPVRPRIPAIGGAAVSSLIRGSGTGDVYRLYAISRRDNVALNVAWIPPETPCSPTEEFDPAFMKCLYDFGGQLLRTGGLWRTSPPFFRDALPPPDLN